MTLVDRKVLTILWDTRYRLLDLVITKSRRQCLGINLFF